MAEDANEEGPDLAKGVSLADFGDERMLRGRVGDEAVLLARLGDEVVAMDATCSHYGGPLDEGLLVGETVRCPWHHACFALRTGEAIGAPALKAVGVWEVQRDGDRIVVVGRKESSPAALSQADGHRRPDDVLILGGGASGFACAEMLRRHGFEGRIKILSNDADAPYDRPQLSKQFLAGGAEADDLPLEPEEFYAKHDIDLHLNTDVTQIDLDQKQVTDGDGVTHSFDCLVLAAGAEPVTLPIPGADMAHVHTLRTARDSKAISDAAEGARKAVVLGSGFIGLETAASLTKRDVEVQVVTQDDQPLVKVLGPELSRRLRKEHESHGTKFHTGTTISSIEQDEVVLEDGTRLEADLVILGVGVKPRVGLAEAAGLEVDDGVLVDECLRASAPGVYATGDIARWLDPRHDRRLRVEHWVLAERHGQHVARNILAGDKPFTDPPFFWTAHHDMRIRYVGHAEEWDEIDIDGDVENLDCTVRYRKDGRTLALVTLGRDVESLEWEAKEEKANEENRGG